MGRGSGGDQRAKEAVSQPVRHTDKRSSPDAVLRRAQAFLQLQLPHVPVRSTDAERVEKTIWGSPAGKKRLAVRLVKMIPPHKTYVEPFAGSAAVFFAKPRAEKEVLSDADPEIADAFKALTTLTDGDLASLKKKEWVGRERIFQSLKKAKPSGKVEKLYRFLYLSHFAYGALRGKSYDAHAEGIEARTIARIEKHRERLRGVTVRSGDYAAVVKEFDSKNTFFFLDPPYPGYNVQVGEDRFDETDFRKVLDGIRGKFLVTYGARGDLNTEGFHVKKIRTPRTIRHMRNVGGSEMLEQRLISNYAITQKSLGPYLLDDVEAEVCLGADVANDIEHARALANALAGDPVAKSVWALAAALEQLEGPTDARARALATDLLPLARRLAPALADVPEVAAACRKSLPALTKLAGIPRRAPAAPPVRAPAPPAPPGALAAVLGKRIPVLKTGEERYVLGIVLEPETVDAQQDIYADDTVRNAAHRFMEEFRNVGLMHQGLVNSRVKILESYVAPAAFELDGTQVRKGTWLLAVRVLDDALWEQVRSGELTGFSIGGSAVRKPE
jgi:site-specific DNA-adenine methylase